MNSKIEKDINFIKELLNNNISDDLLIRILFEMGRYFDKQFVKEIQATQKKIKRIFNQNERNLLRLYYYYQNEKIINEIGITDFKSIQYDDNDVINILHDCITRCEKYNSDKILSSIKERQYNQENEIIVNYSDDWLSYYYKKVKENYKYSSFILNIDQNDFQKNNYSINHYYEIISSIYADLENYRHLFIVIKGNLMDKDNVDKTWNIIYKLGIYCENFIKFDKKFIPFKKDKSKEKLLNFLNERFPENNNKKLVDNFYSSISTGFKYEDCFISENQSSIILSYKKISLDDSPIPCPSCMTTIQQSNSFPEMFLRSFECKNPNCKERSKSGRGKRFDEYGTYRYCKLIENEECNQINYDLYEKWRRDIFSNDNNIYEMILKYYTWGGETICVYPNCSNHELYSRNLITYNKTKNKLDNYYKDYNSLPIIELMESIKNILNRKTGDVVLLDKHHIINEESAKGIRNLKKSQVGYAITSPPYYNAREYSQWQTLIMYLIDMMINSAAVYDTLHEDGYYLYNIGDIVNSDNIYVESNMSKRRLQLGFLSCMFFELVGFNLTGNIIWDKGQVQSKRNSTVNLNSGYIKPINCYEHVLIFKKGNVNKHECLSKVSKFAPVIKINSKGVNTYKHTAPYPLDMVDLLKPIIKTDDKYILDPFLGSGTTVLWCKNNGYKGVGFELNNEYYKLCRERIFDNTLFNQNDKELI